MRLKGQTLKEVPNPAYTIVGEGLTLWVLSASRIYDNISLMNIIKYLKEVRIELSKVSWPTREEIVKLTTIILVASLIVGLYVGGLDVLFTNLLGMFLK